MASLEQRLLDLATAIGGDVKQLNTTAVIPATLPSDSDILEFSEAEGKWIPKKDPRDLYLDGGNF